MIEQVVGWVLVLQNYFISLCQNVSFCIKRLGSLTFHTSYGVSKKFDVCQKNDDIYKKQILVKPKVRPSSEIPGPPCLPLFGTFFDFNKFGVRRIHELSIDRHAKYGDIFREKLFGTELVFVKGFDLYKEWCAQEGKAPVSTKQEPSFYLKQEHPHLDRGLFWRDGDEWLRLRKYVHTVLIKNASEFQTSGMFESCELYYEDLMKKLHEKVNNGGIGIENLETEAYEMIIGALLTVVYGSNSEKFAAYTGIDYKKLARQAREINYLHSKLLDGSVRLAKMFQTKTWREYSAKQAENLNACNKFCVSLRKEVMESPETATLKSYGLFYKMMLLNPPQVDADQLVTDFAIDTKDPLACSAMYIHQVLGMHPEIQEKMYEEIMSVYPAESRISYNKLGDLKYTEGFIREVLRLYPIAAFSSRIVVEETTIGNYRINPGTILNYSTFAAHRDPRNFANPLKVWPERWFGNEQWYDREGNEAKKEGENICNVAAFAGFGLKKRFCLGLHVGVHILQLYVANLVRNFKVTSLELPKLSMNTVLFPVNAREIKLEAR